MRTRGVKSLQEISQIKKACALGDNIYSQILKKIRIGISEKELAGEIIRLIRSNNASLSFRPIVSFGKNSSEIHHNPTDLKLRKNHGFIMIDLGTKLNGYCSDMTRTVFFGKANIKQKKMYQTVRESQQKGIDFVKEGCKAVDVDRISRDYVIKKGFLPFAHTLGHGIGKKVHEGFRLGPKSKTKLQNGMVFTIEPGIYIKNYGGVRIEDVFYLNKRKLIQLTCSPKNLLELI